jgi:hypothetical protein
MSAGDEAQQMMKVMKAKLCSRQGKSLYCTSLMILMILMIVSLVPLTWASRIVNGFIGLSRRCLESIQECATGEILGMACPDIP